MPLLRCCSCSSSTKCSTSTSRRTTTRQRAWTPWTSSENHGQRGAVRAVVQARQFRARTDRDAGNNQAKDQYTEVELFDSAYDVVKKASADTSDKTVKDLIALSGFILETPTRRISHTLFQGLRRLERYAQSMIHAFWPVLNELGNWALFPQVARILQSLVCCLGVACVVFNAHPAQPFGSLCACDSHGPN